MSKLITPRKVWLPSIRAGSGSDVFVERLADALNARGIDAAVTWFPHGFEMLPDALCAVQPPPNTDLVHANAAQAFAFKRKGLPLVATELHYVLDPDFRLFKSQSQHLYHRYLIGKYLARSFAAADAITAISHFTARVLEAVPKVSVSRVVPLWVDLDQFKPDIESCRRREARPFRLFFVGNSSRRKGADVIPGLATRLGKHFEIVCTAGLRQQMRGSELSNVHILGRLSQAQLVQEYRDCDAVLVPSRYEGFGYAALEAMACGKPVVGFRSGAIAEVVAAGRTAMLVEIDDLDGLEASCRYLAFNPEVCRAFGQAGRARAEEYFSESVAMESYLQLYSELLGKRD